MTVRMLVSTPKPAPDTFRLLAQIMSTFFFSSLAWLLATMSRVSMEKPQMTCPGRRCSPSQARMSVVRFRGMDRSPSFFLILSPL